MQAEWAGQQALCNALLVPGVNCNTGSDSISVCNDGQTICCPGFGPVTIAANQFCQDLNITGLNQGQIDSATAALKANLNAQAIDVICPAFKISCSITHTTQDPGSLILVQVHNQSAIITFDSSTFQLCSSAGVAYQNSIFATIAPLAQAPCLNALGPPTVLPFKVKYQGYVIYTDPNPNAGFDRRVDVFVGCGFPAPC
jgi:hypothetical protein